jgi:hypothetical protein
LRWLAPVWLAVYLPAYSITYGLANFLFVCNIAVLTACVGLWRGSALLLSSAALSSIVIDPAWTLDLAWRLLLGHHLIGGTEYMWDPRWPLPVRLLSLYHVALPVLLLLALRRTGYDRRAYWLQSLIAVAAVLAGRLADPGANINSAFVDPILKRAFEPAALHLAATRSRRWCCRGCSHRLVDSRMGTLAIPQGGLRSCRSTFRAFVHGGLAAIFAHRCLPCVLS